jgi:hypothetical protein
VATTCPSAKRAELVMIVTGVWERASSVVVSLVVMVVSKIKNGRGKASALAIRYVALVLKIKGAALQRQHSEASCI